MTTTPPSRIPKLRDYQEAAVQSIFGYFAEGGRGNPLVALPTGTGKSLVLAAFVERAFKGYPGQRLVLLTHVKELIQQNYLTMLRLWPTAPAGIFSAGLDRKDSHYPITFAGIASAVKCPDVFGRVDLVIIDEAHLVSPKDGTMYQTFLKALREVNPALKVIGLTATHYRLGQGLLTETDGIFTANCFDLTTLSAFNWLLDQGYLCRLVPRQVKAEIDTSEVKIHGGEFIQKDLQEAVDKAELTHAAIKELLELAGGRKHWLLFATGIAHAEHISEMLESFGVSSTCVHSKMGDKERDANILGFKQGKYTAMVNNGILTTGFDFPDIDLIGMLRPTQSPGLWVQMLGRGTRPVYEPGYPIDTPEERLAAIAASPKPNCLVLDFAGNTRRLGPINDPVIPKRKGKGGGGGAPVKVCEVCMTYNHASVRICVHCGSEFPIHTKLDSEASTDALIVDDRPVVEKFKVDRVVYAEHRKEGRPTAIKVSYYCGLRCFNEWVCLDHDGYAKKKARDWWRGRAQVEPPASTMEAMARLNELRQPVSLNVWINRKYPEVMNYDY